MATQAGLAELLASLGDTVGEVLGAVATDICTFEESALTDDGHGGKTQEWAAVGALTKLPCIAYPNAAQARVLGDVPTSKTVYSVLVKGGSAVTSTMRVKLLARGGEPERVLDIKSVLPSFGVVVEVVGLVSI
jgi:hypothetical protein